MSLGNETRQTTRQLELPLGQRGEASSAERSGETQPARKESGRSGNDYEDLMVLVVERSNVEAALRRVRRNKGSPGIDGMKVEELSVHLTRHWPSLREQLLAGTYRPNPVRRHAIPKDGGGVRELGIPTVVDRLIQQCILQVLQPGFDASFSQHSYGFRPGRRAHDAICTAQRYIQEGRHWVVDVDLEKFFDRVNHDVLMGRLAKRIKDRRLLRLIRRYLEAGIMASGVVLERHEGTPQGGPLSPLLANVLLDEVDKELERRGHAFVRYADDCNVYVRSQRAGERVMQALRRLYAKLRLRVNETKSAVAPPWGRKFLGYRFLVTRDGRVKRGIASQALKAMKDRVRAITWRSGGRSLRSVAAQLRDYLPGWKEYFRLIETPTILRDLDSWIRRRLRALLLKQWRNPHTIYVELRSLGLTPKKAAQIAAGNGRWWRSSGSTIHIALPAAYFDKLGVPRLTA